MKLPWVSRTRYEELRKETEKEAIQLFSKVKQLEAHKQSLLSTIGTLRAEAIAHKQDIQKLTTDLNAATEEIARLTRRPVSRPQPKLGNFLRTRDGLEAAAEQGTPIIELEREKKTKATKEA